MPTKGGRSCQACCAKCVQILTTHFSILLTSVQSQTFSSTTFFLDRGTWVSASTNTEHVSGVLQIVELLMRPVFACASIPLFLALQQTMSRDVANLYLSNGVFLCPFFF